METEAKVWGIGVGRTGTRSLAQALTILGYYPIHNPISLDAAEEKCAAIEGACLTGYRYLNYCYPQSKFILTTRELFAWIDSCKRAFERWPLERLEGNPQFYSAAIKNRLARFGCTQFNYEKLIEHYFRHHAEVTSFFSTYPGQLLVIDLTIDPSWDALCSFLDLPVPEVDFPFEK